MANFSLDIEELVELGTAEIGVCENGCYSLGIFLGVSIVALFIVFILQVPNIVITIRSAKYSTL